MQFDLFMTRCTKTVFVLLATCLASLLPAIGQAEKYKVVPLQTEIAQEYDLDTAFYKKST